MAATITALDQNLHGTGVVYEDNANGDRVAMTGSAVSSAVSYVKGQMVDVTNDTAAKVFVRTDGSAATSDGKSLVILAGGIRMVVIQAAGPISLLGTDTTSGNYCYLMPAKYS